MYIYVLPLKKKKIKKLKKTLNIYNNGWTILSIENANTNYVWWKKKCIIVKSTSINLWFVAAFRIQNSSTISGLGLMHLNLLYIMNSMLLPITICDDQFFKIIIGLIVFGSSVWNCARLNMVWCVYLLFLFFIHSRNMSKIWSR